MVFTWLVGAGALAVGVICTALVLHRDYEDGLVGRVALSFIAMAALARLLDLIEHGGEAVPVTVISFLLWDGLALFLARHACRFLRAVRRSHDWRAARHAEVTGKQ